MYYLLEMMTAIYYSETVPLVLAFSYQVSNTPKIRFEYKIGQGKFQSLQQIFNLL